MSIEESFDGKVDFQLDRIQYENGESGTTRIEFEYARPSIGIDNKGRFVTHEIIGGTTVRQKIGEEPRELSVNGVIKGDEMARDLDGLRDAKNALVAANRLPGETMKCQITSVTTSPMSDGGGVALEDGKFLYTFRMKLIELTRLESESSSGRGGGVPGGSDRPRLDEA